VSWSRHDPAHAQKIGVNLVSNTAQRAGFAGFKWLPVNNLAFCSFHGMEEVIGSIPIGETAQLRAIVTRAVAASVRMRSGDLY
jgi:hypothetical protein